MLVSPPLSSVAVDIADDLRSADDRPPADDRRSVDALRLETCLLLFENESSFGPNPMARKIPPPLLRGFLLTLSLVESSNSIEALLEDGME